MRESGERKVGEKKEGNWKRKMENGTKKAVWICMNEVCVIIFPKNENYSFLTFSSPMFLNARVPLFFIMGVKNFRKSIK